MTATTDSIFEAITRLSGDIGEIKGSVGKIEGTIKGIEKELNRKVDDNEFVKAMAGAKDEVTQRFEIYKKDNKKNGEEPDATMTVSGVNWARVKTNCIYIAATGSVIAGPIVAAVLALKN